MWRLLLRSGSAHCDLALAVVRAGGEGREAEGARVADPPLESNNPHLTGEEEPSRGTSESGVVIFLCSWLLLFSVFALPEQYVKLTTISVALPPVYLLCGSHPKSKP